MAFTILSKAIATAVLLITTGQALATSIGLPTHDQNPMLQAYYMPSINLQIGRWTAAIPCIIYYQYLSR